ncbi:kinase-like protein [Daedalea quercina L-15889]|uniref:non-specific serine/threonine protein kinase n=1 Tax=Daedalea quercina L-15889 TaxID=1314783 RepID=A0A165SGU9_9APHY|nr:kinase-like protein [Daedalea quercina L-15889]
MQHAVGADDVHVRVIFDEAGNITVCKVEPVRRVECQMLAVQTSIVKGTSPKKQCDIGSQLIPSSSSHTFHNINISDNTKPSHALSTATLLSQPASPALSGTSTLVDDNQPLKHDALDTSDFEAVRVIGRGAQGVVTLVRGNSTGLYHALKTISTTKLKAASFIQLFEEQATLKRLAGIPWFVELQGSFYDSKNFFLLTKYYRNGSLSALMDRCRLSLTETRRFAAELIFSVALLHQKRVVHGDIKPDNLLLDDRGHLVVADFGMARSFDQPSELAPWRELRYALEEAGYLQPKDPELERADATCRAVGTPVYAAPEAWCKSFAPQSYPADIWSAGVTIYEMLTGRLPFGPHNRYLPAVQMCRATVSKPLTFPDDPDIYVDNDARDLLHKMLQVDASKRPSIAAIKKHPYFKSINWLEIAMRQAPVTTPLPVPLHESLEEQSASLPTPAPHDGDNDDDRNPCAWFPWVSPTMHTPSEDVYSAVDSAIDVPAAIDEGTVPPLAKNATTSLHTKNTVPNLAGTLWGALKRKLAFTGRWSSQDQSAA